MIQKFKNSTKVYCIKDTIIEKPALHISMFFEGCFYDCKFDRHHADDYIEVTDDLGITAIFLEYYSDLSNFITIQEYRQLKIKDLLNTI